MYAQTGAVVPADAHFNIKPEQQEKFIMAEVQVLEARKNVPNSKSRQRGAPIRANRIRVAAYCRVSTGGDEQLGSFESQKLYYEEKIGNNPDWVNAGIFADEAIIGTKVDKR